MHSRSQFGCECNATFGNYSSDLWARDLNPLFHQILDYSGYHEDAKQEHTAFFERFILPGLGIHPAAVCGINTPRWRSFMNDDFTPIEFSWSWNKSGSVPKLRYGFEPIGMSAGTSSDQSNKEIVPKIIQVFEKMHNSFDTKWFHHFMKTTTCYDTQEHMGIDTESDCQSQLFFAVELGNSNTHVKAYFVPSRLAGKLNVTNSDLIQNAILSLPDADVALLSSFDMLQRHISSLPEQSSPQVEMVGIDCVEPELARIKVYVRVRDTTFDMVVRMMTLNGKIPFTNDRSSIILRKLWSLVLSLNEDFDESRPLPSKSHRTSGVIYHYDLRIGQAVPKVKVYIPVKHYGENDYSIAKGFNDFLISQNRSLHRSSYLNAMQDLCHHRNLKDSRGFQTYISCTLENGEAMITSYFQPEIYSRYT